MSASLINVVSELQKIGHDLSLLATKVVCHGRKIQFAVSQFNKFVNLLSKKTNPTPLTRDQQNAYTEIVKITRSYKAIFKSYLIDSWSLNAIEQGSSEIPSSLWGLSAQLREVTTLLDADSAEAFTPNSSQWLSLHILDLRAINQSFKQYLEKQAGPNPDLEAIIQDPNLDRTEKKMATRVMSINNFLKQYENEDVAPGVRFFSPIPVTYQNWRINHDDLEELKSVGSGVSSVVYFGHYKPTGEEVAIKKLKFKTLTGAKLDSFQRELSILATAVHPTILKFVGATDTAPFCIVTQWMPNGSLYHDIHKYHRLNETFRTIAAFDIARGMQFLHSKSIIHRDLKSLNVLIDQDRLTHICDFGYSKQMEGKNALMTKNVGTPHWMAPELLTQSDNYDNKVDVYAYAIVFWELVTCQLPYNGMEPTQIIAQVLMNNARPRIPSTLSGPTLDLMTMCWDREPKSRPTFTEILLAFREGSIMIPGADQDEVMKYIEAVPLTEEERQIKDVNTELQSQSSSMTFNDLQAMVERLEAHGISKDEKIMKQLWSYLEHTYQEPSIKSNPDAPSLYMRAVSCFIDSTLQKVALKTLNDFSTKFKFDKQLIDKILNFYPIGDTEVDNYLVEIACRNHSAPRAALCTIDNNQLKMAFEVCGQEGVTEEYRKPLVNLCLKHLTASDTYLQLASLRCLVGIKAASQIPPKQILLLIQSRQTSIRQAAYVAAAEMAIEGMELPSDLVEQLASKWDEKIASTAVVAACKSLPVAKQVLTLLSSGTALPNEEIQLRIYNMAAKFNELKPEVKKRLSQFHSTQHELIRVVQTISQGL